MQLSNLNGILTIIISASIAVGGMVWGIIHFARYSHEDLHNFPISLAKGAAGRTEPFHLEAGQEVSIWLLMASRELEGHAFSLSVMIEGADGATRGKAHEDFAWGTLRNRYGNSVYYRLGNYAPSLTETVRLNHQRSGDWVPQQGTGSLVVRRALPFSLPWPAVLMFVGGLTGVGFGIRLLLKM